MRLTLERALVEPNENESSFQKANWDMLTVGGGYGLGHFGKMSDKLSLEVGYLQKLFGYAPPATQLYTTTLRYVS